MGRREQPPNIPPRGEIPLGVKIRARRWSQGLSLSQLAQAVGNYDRSYLSHAETGKAQPSQELVEQIATALHLDVNELRTASRGEVLQWLSTGRPTLPPKTYPVVEQLPHEPLDLYDKREIRARIRSRLAALAETNQISEEQVDYILETALNRYEEMTDVIKDLRKQQGELIRKAKQAYDSLEMADVYGHYRDYIVNQAIREMVRNYERVLRTNLSLRQRERMAWDIQQSLLDGSVQLALPLDYTGLRDDTEEFTRHDRRATDDDAFDGIDLA